MEHEHPESKISTVCAIIAIAVCKLPYGFRYARSTLQFDLEELMEYYQPLYETGYSIRPDCGYFFDFQMDAVKSFFNTGAELIAVPGTLLYEKGGQ